MTNEEKREFLQLRMKVSQAEGAFKAIKARIEGRLDDLDLMLYGTPRPQALDDIAFITMAALHYLQHVDA